MCHLGIHSDLGRSDSEVFLKPGNWRDEALLGLWNPKSSVFSQSSFLKRSWVHVNPKNLGIFSLYIWRFWDFWWIQMVLSNKIGRNKNNLHPCPHYIKWAFQTHKKSQVEPRRSPFLRVAQKSAGRPAILLESSSGSPMLKELGKNSHLRTWSNDEKNMKKTLS